MKKLDPQLDSILHSMMDGVISINENHEVILFNAAAEKMFGYSTKKALGQFINRFIPERYQDSNSKDVKSFGVSGATKRGMGSLGLIFGLRANGEEFPIEASISQLKRGNQQLYTVVLRDITERKRDEEVIKRLLWQNQLILHSAGEGIYGLDTQGNTTFVNPAAAKMLGYAPDELIGVPMHVTTHHTKPDGSPYPREECPMYAAFQDGTVHTVENEVLWRKDGTSFPVRYISTPIKDEEDHLLGAVVTFSDMTELKRDEEVIKQLLRQNQLILHSAGEGIYGLDTQGNTTFVNPAAAKMLGYAPDELIGVPMHVTMHHTKTDGSPYPREECPMYAAFQDGTVHTVENEVQMGRASRFDTSAPRSKMKRTISWARW
jgi:PAS domain S-box-containing protein